jgi:hypothetical protein
VERLHKTMRAEFFRAADGQYATLTELQAALDSWVSEYNTTRPHQSCGGRPPAERFRLADRSITPDDSAAVPPSPPVAPRPAASRTGTAPAGDRAAGRTRRPGLTADEHRHRPRPPGGPADPAATRDRPPATRDVTR